MPPMPRTPLSAPRSLVLLAPCCAASFGGRGDGNGFVINDAVQVVDELVTNAAHATGLMEERPRWTALAALLHHRAAARLGSEYPYRGLGQCA